MAAYAAHLTRTASGEPNLFTLSAQDALANTVKPALRKLLEYSCAVRPGSADWLLRWYDEFYLILDALLQHHYLQHYAASFSESFYGLWRVAAGRQDFADGRRLPVRLERASLALLVLAPYLRDRAQYCAERWRAQMQDGQLDKGATGAAKRAAVHVYSVVHTMVELAKLAQLCRFVTGRAGSHAPALALLQLRLARAPPPLPDTPTTWRGLFTTLATGQLWSSGGGALAAVGGLALRGVELGAFLVQFLKWWEARGGSHATTLPAPPPPARATAPALARTQNKCALCLQPWRTPTALPVSGYVFCYSCIARHLARHGRCPLTRLPAPAQSLVRLYLDV